MDARIDVREFENGRTYIVACTLLAICLIRPFCCLKAIAALLN